MSGLEVRIEEYKALRAEICQSIAKQHQILLSGYGLTAAAVGYLIGTAGTDWRGFAVVPMPLLAMTALWAVECNRMVRASYYIGFKLWPTLAEGNDGWEQWIRLRGDHPGEFRRRQDVLQQIVVVIIPVCLSTGSMIIAISSTVSEAEWLIGLSVFSVLLLGAWCWVYSHIRTVSDLAGITPSIDAPSVAVASMAPPAELP
jgi:hypothetical protein